MAEVIRRRCRRLKAEGVEPPDLLVVDGGKGQLGAAVRELKEAGWEAVPAIGDRVRLSVDPGSVVVLPA